MAFYDCKELKQIVLSENIEEISDYMCAESGIGFIKIPDKVTKIEGSAFLDCKKLKSVVIPDKVESIGAFSFYMCNSLSKVTLGKEVKTIEMGFCKIEK